ncbi:ArsR/SmtB family transcription factor [Williamsoniiplasma lucivorax]|uniref:Transcriptional regulator n=1 Tax=Williamsoniiplasma lucivorax TaxID=209274 RepID=A0A2S5RFF5_9MOLU|nr:metalloregulator ArsR/SmtB family transcription factor [Williamsoniiplasma lucivorax]PPE06059.1 transcriptional regulator [Williamsoniiplasma lucivorax]
MEYNYDDYALMFKVLSDPTRLKIVELLTSKSFDCLCARNLLKELHITQPTLSYHMKFLEEVGFVKVIKEGTLKIYDFDLTKFSKLRHFLNEVGNQ